MMGGFGCWETLQILVWGVLSCFGACVFCLCQNLFTLPETSTWHPKRHQAWGIGFGLVASSGVSLGPRVFWNTHFFWKITCFRWWKTHQYYSKRRGCLRANMKKHSTAFCSFLFSSTSPKSWCWYMELHLSDEVNVPLNVDGKKQKLAICWGDRCVTTNNTETKINRAFGEFLNLQDSIYFQEVFFSTNAIGKKHVCFARPVAAAFFPQKGTLWRFHGEPGIWICKSYPRNLLNFWVLDLKLWVVSFAT